MPRTLQDVAEAMRDIDFCTLATIAEDGSIAGRPMSNNREVEFDGDAWFFTSENTRIVSDIERTSQVGMTYLGNPGVKAIFGAPGAFFHVEGRAEVVRDKAQFEAHWHKELERWYPQGTDTPDMVMLMVHARRIHYWDGEEDGEVSL